MQRTREDIESDINNWFVYHAPQGDQLDRYVSIRDKAKELALHVLDCTPICLEQTMAIRKIREVVMMANAAIACNETPSAADPAEAHADPTDTAPPADEQAT